jgi:hypothetical protein
LCGGLSSPVTGLDFGRCFTYVFLVYPAKALFEQLQADILIIKKHSGNQTPVAIDCVWPEFDIFTEYQLAHRLFGQLAERLASFWRIDKCDTYPDLLLAKDQHVDGVAIDNTYYTAMDSHVLQAKSVRGGLERILA